MDLIKLEYRTTGMMNKSHFLGIALTVATLAMSAHASLIGFNAENGSSATTTVTASLGSDFASPQSDPLRCLGGGYITIKTSGGGESPGGGVRTATYTVNFPEAGTYDLYARVLVEVDGSDDSLFYGNGFGTKGVGIGSDWIHVNRIFDAGGGKGIGSGRYAWINLSKWIETEAGVNYSVPSAGNYTFQIGGRENGLRIDALAFGASGGTYTNTQLNASVDLAFEPTTAARVFIIGDSTVSSYDVASTTQTGWGQVFFHYFENSVEIRNHADPGESTKTFYNGSGFWRVVKSQLAEGDYLFMQFGHNDSHDPANPEATTTVEYKAFLQAFIDEAKAKGAIPVLVSPMYRRSFVNGALVSYHPSVGQNDLGPYAAAMAELAAAPGNEDVPFIDLFKSSGTFMQAIGDAECIKLLQPNDATHWNRKGATVMAALVARGVAAKFPTPASPVPAKELSQYLRREVLKRHAADIDNGVTQLRPIFTLEKHGGWLWLDWFLQPSGVTLQKTNDLGEWTAWDIGAGAATGGDGLTVIRPDVEGSSAFFRLVGP
jgi:lysophospholipase L1-like esterase